MIPEPLLRSTRDAFTRHAALTEDEQRRRRAIGYQEQKQREEKEARDSREAHLHALLVAELASPAEIAAFTVKLDGYDAATVEAMIANEEALAKLRAELTILRDKAYVLEDGRRVYKTEDGTRVFDEQGQEVEALDPKRIEDWRPKWEAFAAKAEAERTLVDERAQLTAYQDRLDAARGRLDDEGLGTSDLDQMERELQEEMPEAVRRRVAAIGAPEAELDPGRQPQAQPDILRPVAKIDAPSL